MNYSKWLDKNTHSLKGKTVAVSGATGGIGKRICEFLSALDVNIVCLDRNSDKSNNLIADLKNKYPDLSATHITVDLENIYAVKNAVSQLKGLEIDYLILNAGAYKIPRHKCDSGYNNVFQINYVSPYYLARELYPQIKSRGGRIVAVSSIAHNYSKININDIDFSDVSASSKVYGNAKRFLTFSLFGLFNNDKTLSVVHPGITLTNITAHYPKIIFAIIKYPMKIIFMSPKKAALCIIYGVFNGTGNYEWISPRLFNVWGLPKKRPLNSCDADEAKQICEISEKMYYDIKNKP